jgi:hypothetical protein
MGRAKTSGFGLGSEHTSPYHPEKPTFSWVGRKTGSRRCALPRAFHEKDTTFPRYEKTMNLRVTHRLLGDQTLESAVRHSGIEVDDALKSEV